MKIVFMGCVEFSYRTMEHLLTLPNAEVVGVVTRASSAINADFRSLEPLAHKAGIPCFLAQGNRQDELADWLSGLQPDVVFCFGWSYLLRPELLSIPRHGFIGYHPAALPKNRGRHPIIWALALGLPETASTFFFMDEGADSGDILSQVAVPISNADDAATLYARLTETALEQITSFTNELAGGHPARVPQDHELANYWRKRSRRDGEIDWRMSARTIHNLVRALTRPYPGAHCLHEGQEVKVWKTELGEWGAQNLEPGKVLQASGNTLLIQCGEGAIRLLEHEFESLPKEGCYL